MTLVSGVSAWFSAPLVIISIILALGVLVSIIDEWGRTVSILAVLLLIAAISGSVWMIHDRVSSNHQNDTALNRYGYVLTSEGNKKGCVSSYDTRDQPDPGSWCTDLVARTMIHDRTDGTYDFNAINVKTAKTEHLRLLISDNQLHLFKAKGHDWVRITPPRA